MTSVKRLSGMRAKMAARDERRRKEGGRKNKSPTGVRYAVPQTKGGIRETAEQRRKRLDARRVRQLTRQPPPSPTNNIKSGSE